LEQIIGISTKHSNIKVEDLGENTKYFHDDQVKKRIQLIHSSIFRCYTANLAVHREWPTPF